MDAVAATVPDPDVLELAEAVKNDLDAVLDGLTWTQNRPLLATAQGSGGGPTERHYTFGVARALDEDEWDRSVAVVAAHARTAGFTGASLVVDRLADHEVVFLADDGRSLTFGTAAATILRASVRPGRTAPGATAAGSDTPAGSSDVAGADAADAGADATDPDATDPAGADAGAAGTTTIPDTTLDGPDHAFVPEAEPDIIDEVPKW